MAKSSVFAAAQQSVRDQRPSAVRDEVQTQGAAAVLQSAAASEALMDLGRLRQEAMATPQGPGVAAFSRGAGPAVSPHHHLGRMDPVASRQMNNARLIPRRSIERLCS